MAVVTAAKIREAAELIRGQVVRTPCTYSRVLSKITGADVWLKFEIFQFTASFKERGALTKLLSLSQPERDAGVVAVSAGNHAQGVAHHATRLGIRSIIVMPNSTPFTKVRNTRELGGEVVLHGESLAEAAVFMQQEYVEKLGMTLVHPYDDAQIVAGQGTVGLEMMEDVPELDTLVVPIGGGGLIAGIAVAAHSIKPDALIVGVESVGYPSAYAALQNDATLVKGGSTIAEGIAVQSIGKLPLEIIREHVGELVRVEESAIERAIGLLANVEKVVVEGAGAAGLAALISDPARFAGRKLGLVICGGNIDTRLFASVLMRQLVHEQRLVAFSIEIEDRPGFLARVAGRIGESGGNIMQVHHERLAMGTSAKRATLEVLVEAQDEGHAKQIEADLVAMGLVARRTDAGGIEFD